MDINKVNAETNQQTNQTTKDDIGLLIVDKENTKTPEEVILNKEEPNIQKLLKIVSVAICLLAIPYFIYTIKKDQSFDNLQKSWITTFFMISLIYILSPIKQKLLKFVTILTSSLAIPYFIYIFRREDYFDNFWELTLMTLFIVSVSVILISVVLNPKKVEKINDLPPFERKIVNYFGDKIFYWILIVLGMLALGLINTFLIKSPTTKVKENISIPITTEIPGAKKTLLDLQKSLKINSPINLYFPTLYFDWVVDRDSRVPLTTEGFNLVRKEYSDNSGVLGNFNISQETTEEPFKPLKKLIDDFFVSNNFIINSENTYKFSRYEDYIGYTKDDLKCSVKLSYQSDPFGFVYCGIVEQNQIKLRQELSSAINPNKDTNVAFDVDKIIGNWAQGDVGYYSSNSIVGWIATKINGGWELIYSGQDRTSCDVMDKYNIPKEFYGACYDIKKREFRE